MKLNKEKKNRRMSRVWEEGYAARCTRYPHSLKTEPPTNAKQLFENGRGNFLKRLVQIFKGDRRYEKGNEKNTDIL